MPAALADHLWQCLLFTGLCGGLAWLTRHNSAVVRLWLWRVCVAKLLLPFALLFGLGRWLGFPAYHSADPLPVPLVRAFDALAPVFAPVQSAQPGTGAAWLCLLAMLPAGVLFTALVRRALRLERWRAREESMRLEEQRGIAPPALGFFKAALFSFCLAILVSGVLLGGAVADRRWRLELLGAHARALRGAVVAMTEARPGMGTRSRIEASADGILIRNIDIQDLIALAYGVNHYAVWSKQMISDDAPDARSWLVSPRYDVRVRAPIVAPADFDPYALRQPITRFLAERFGLEIHVNDRCQPPCGVYGMPLGAGPL